MTSLPTIQHTLQAEGFDDDAALDETIKKLESDLKKARKRELGDDDNGGLVRLFWFSSILSFIHIIYRRNRHSH